MKGLEESQQAAWLDLLAEGQPRNAAAQQVGIPLRELRIALRFDATLEAEAEAREAEADGKVAQALFEAATSGNVPATKLWLEARQTGIWRK